MFRHLTLIATILLLAVPAAAAQQQTTDEDPPRRATTRPIERPMTMQRPSAEADADDADEQPPVNQESRRFQTINNAAFEAAARADDYDVGGRWACGCSGGGDGQCRAIVEDGSLSCYPAEEGGCTTGCSLATTHDPAIGSGPRSTAGD